MQTRGASAFECGCLWQHMNHSGNTKRKSLNWSILDSLGWVLHLEHQASQRFDLLTLPHVIFLAYQQTILSPRERQAGHRWPPLTTSLLLHLDFISHM